MSSGTAHPKHNATWFVLACRALTVLRAENSYRHFPRLVGDINIKEGGGEPTKVEEKDSVIIVWGGGESVVKNENELDGDDSNEGYPETEPDESDSRARILRRVRVRVDDLRCEQKVIFSKNRKNMCL